ncbi:hypothetical protein [Sphaerisporangium aureirubrum]|uniref:Uncharacterized protein n=1 Tax=Sphaerisporangium aureirubrum TaxID=1544736 RepID=A0ABW1NJR4_9ACTN
MDAFVVNICPGRDCRVNVVAMQWWQAGLWGLAGGGASGLVSLMTAIVNAGYRWPWRKKGSGDFRPRLFVLACGMLLGALVAAAASAQISGPWPAFIFGVGATATIRGVLSGVEIVPPTSEATATPARPRLPQPRRRNLREEEEAR